MLALFNKFSQWKHECFNYDILLEINFKFSLLIIISENVHAYQLKLNYFIKCSTIGKDIQARIVYESVWGQLRPKH